MIANFVTSTRIALLVPLFFFVQAEPSGSWAALAVFLLAGLTDVIDGRLARTLNQVSRFGAMLDLLADRLLTFTVLVGLISGGALKGGFLVAALILLARDLIVASFGESVPNLGFKVSNTEKVKITFQFLGIGLLISPRFFEIYGEDQHSIGRYAISISAALTCVTLITYSRRTLAALEEMRRP
ncbi:MAG: CDP-alcohol phosphatidyltransferase family protein [Phenylobacterium sp.]|uniref:CDP-alcohol phosphatidyltransferase family protein n=1 Tax=Phenylobacterium sp. TaxID=1871053 RepID=UPI00301A20D9